ncbi:hypothetical protein S83_071219 [Arachis hypogaea]
MCNVSHNSVNSQTKPKTLSETRAAPTTSCHSPSSPCRGISVRTHCRRWLHRRSSCRLSSSVSGLCSPLRASSLGSCRRC